MDNLLNHLQDKFGAVEGLRVFNKAMPGIMGDFTKMLKASGVDKVISEEYSLDDGSGVIIVKGSRHADGTFEVETTVE